MGECKIFAFQHTKRVRVLVKKISDTVMRQRKEDANENNLRKQFEQMDLSEILNVQNEVSRNFEKGFIWVLSTCVLLIPDYNFKLVE